jgi:hypothetical protein
MARLILPYQRVEDLNGHPLPGAKMYFYESGTVTPKDTYSDEALTTPNTNPVIADSQGQFGDIFLSGAYSCKLTDANDVTQPDYPAEIAATADTSASVLLTGDQTVAGVKTFTDRTANKSDTPTYELEENDAPVNNRLYQMIAAAEQFILRLANDARDSFAAFMTVDRTANTIDKIDLTATLVDFTATNVQQNGVDIFPAIDEDSMVSDSAVRVPTQQSTKAYVDAQTGTIKLDIGSWNMDLNSQANVIHGVTFADIRSVAGIIRNDADSTRYTITPSFESTPLTNESVIRTIDSVDILLERKTGGLFDTANFDLTEYNLDNAAAVDKGSGLVGIPITAHTFNALDTTTIAGTTNYDGTYTIISETTNEIVITATFQAETFAGTETASWSRGWLTLNMA